MKKILFYLFFCAFLYSCSKEEGEGGTSHITGKVLIRDYNFDFSQLIYQYYAPEEDVYIVYGDDKVYAERFRTHYDGTYRFEFLRKGKYTIYAYSRDSINESPAPIAVKQTVEITERNQEVEVPLIIVLK